MIAEQLLLADLEPESPAVVLWCEEQKCLSVESVADWVGDKMRALALVNDIHLHPVAVFETAEAAFEYVQLQQKKNLSLITH